MRKITLFSSMVCALMFCTSAMAQVVSDLSNKGVKSIGTTPVTSPEVGKWYVMENQGNYAYDDGTGLWSASKASLMTVGSPTSACAKVLFRVYDAQNPVSVEEDGKTGNVTGYKIQWGTGSYTKWPRNGQNEIDFNQQIVTTSNAEDVDFVYVAPIVDGDGFVRFAQNTKTTYGSGNNTLFDKNSTGKISNWSDGSDNSRSKLVAPGTSVNAAWKIYEVTLGDLVSVSVSAEKEGAPTYTANVDLLIGQDINVVDYLAANGLLEYDLSTTTVNIDESTSKVTIKYTNAIPFAESYEALGADEDGNKWVSMYTLNARMYVYDAISETKNGKYPCIDKATFTNLTDKKFWGFICENPLTDYVKIVNKGAGKEKGTLYLTENGTNKALLLATEKGSYITNEWIFEKSTKNEAIATGDNYYGIRAKGTNQYINNYAGRGFMVTLNENTSRDNGSNIKFTSEKGTYETLKERAFTAPAGAVHSLNDAARAAIENNQDNTIGGYKRLIESINSDQNNEGFVQFVEGGYYYLRNYTPANGKTYVLDSKNGTTATTSEVPASLDNSETMDYTNINAIWKITTDPDNPAVDTGSDDIGVSKTIGRFVTHVNSGKKLTGGSDRKLNDSGAAYFFVNLGAGQHFLKNKQYNGSGQQATAGTLSCGDNGNLGFTNSDRNFKNTRHTWYGIPVTGIDVTITDAGYATIYLPFGVTLPEDNSLTAYAVTAVADGVATLTEVKNIPAGQGVILKGEKGQKYTLKIDDEINNGASWEGITNLLKGACMATNVKDDAYVLSKQGDAVGLYKAKKNLEESSAWLNNDNKAYLPASALGGLDARFLSFDFDTVTGLDVIKGTESTSAEASAVYDLSGRRVRAAQKGLYIMNGKKIIK